MTGFMSFNSKQGESEGFDSCDLPSNLTQIGSTCRLKKKKKCVTLKFDGWPQKIIRHIIYTTSSFVYHFISISEFKLELQSGNAQSGSNLTIFLVVWPCNVRMTLKNNRDLFYATWSFVHHFVAIGIFKLELRSGNAQFGSNSVIFRAVWPWNLTDDLEKQ